MGQVVMTIGCPRAGKTTYAEQQIAQSHQPWQKLSLDDLRVAIWGSKSNFWRIQDRRDDAAKDARDALDEIYNHALDRITTLGCNVILANTHLRHGEREFNKLMGRGHTVHLVVFKVPMGELARRNVTCAPDDRVPMEYLIQAYNDFNDPNAWWRKYPGQTEWRH